MRGAIAAAALVVVLASAACAAQPTAGPSAQHRARPMSPTSSIAWLPLPAAHRYPTAPTPPAIPRPPIPVPPGTPACRAGQLEGASAGVEYATGNVNMPIVVRNRGAAACVLQGWADLTILDGRGRLLAAAAGTTFANRGTFFNDWPEVPVLLASHTPPLPARPDSGQPGRHGQVVMNLAWYDCRQPRAAVLLLDLPAAGGRLRAPFDHRSAYSAVCDNPGAKPAGTVARGPLSPAGFPWPPAPRYLDVGVDIHVPASVRRGATLAYQVTLTNRDHGSYRLEPCPDYNEFLGRKDVVASYQLNCQPVGAIAPGQRVTFQMQLAIPTTTATGPNRLIWGLLDGRIATPVATAPLTITDR